MDPQRAVRSIAVLVPAYNEGLRLHSTLSRLLESLDAVATRLTFGVASFQVVVVDDGSKSPITIDPAGLRLQSARVWLLRHPVNLGQGAALCTATQFARDELRADAFVTMDADGQHDPEDLPTLLNALFEAPCDIVFGNRFSGGRSAVPPLRRAILKAATIFERLLSGLRLSDAHNGFRAFGTRTAELLDVQQNRMAHATEIKQIVRRNSLSYREVPVTVRYSAETLEKGQRSSGSLVILRDLLGAYLFRS